MSVQTERDQAAEQSTAATESTSTTMKIEVVVLPVADVDRAKAFYEGLGWRLDIDLSPEPAFRVVEFTPPGSPTAIIFGTGVTDAVPGSTRDLMVVVSDIEAARADLVERGITVSEVFHDAGGVFHHAGTEKRVPGLAPERRSYGSFVSFADPDGNTWIVQEVTQRIPGRTVWTTFDDAAALAQALRRAAAAHGEHEARTGKEDPEWPDWYADYMVREQAGQELPA
ncbi:VOC family protein [Mumia sp. DW29H23]|uniref:VOC family protein n=1 Tax=Mumia sp. DW29H23 TaxID=3421241 RepID=UPI003D6914F6